ncbi:MAG TPA: hypothetical protein PKD12_06150, partial [Nitrospira sp.]|nr:hypothetical protein [Nitrospira sp.]
MTGHRKMCPDSRLVGGVLGFGVLLITGCSLLVSADVKRGDQHLASERWEEASLAYKQALKDDPFNAALQGKYVLAR